MANNKLVTVDVLQYNNEKIKEQLNKKVNIAQGVDNKDKILQVNAEGNLALVDMPDEVKVSAEEGNAITSKDDGLYVPSVSETKISAEEGNAIVSKDDGIYVPTTAETKVSAETDNQIETKEDGIYVAPTDLSDYYKKDETYSRTEVDDAITNAQLLGEAGVQAVELTKAEYDALSDEEKNSDEVVYFVPNTKALPEEVEVVTELNDTVTDKQVPSAKTVYDNLSTLFISEIVEAPTITVAANTTGTATIDLSKEGYTTAIASLQSTGNAKCYLYAANLKTDNTLNYGVFNTTESSLTLSPRFQVLYMKN